MELRVLGPIEVIKDETRVPLGGPKQRAVLALLIANAGRPVATDAIIDGLYGDESTVPVDTTIHFQDGSSQRIRTQLEVVRLDQEAGTGT